MATTTERNDEAPGSRARGRSAEPVARALFHHAPVGDGCIEKPTDHDAFVSEIARHLPRAAAG
jgi:hypothetical protein